MNRGINSLQNDIFFMSIALKLTEIYINEVVEFYMGWWIFWLPKGGCYRKVGGVWYIVILFDQYGLSSPITSPITSQSNRQSSHYPSHQPTCHYLHQLVISQKKTYIQQFKTRQLRITIAFELVDHQSLIKAHRGRFSMNATAMDYNQL